MKKVLSNKYLMMGILALLFVIGGTYALFVWSSSSTTDVAVTVEGVKILYAKGPDIIDADIQPTFTKEEGISKEIKVSLDKVPQLPVTINFYLDIIDIDEELNHETFKWEFYKNGTKATSGNFSSATPDTTIDLISTQMTTTTKDTYILYIWIDANLSNPASMAGKSFSFTLRADGSNAIYEEVCSTNSIKPDSVSNSPKLADGMIPIVYDECNNTWVKADTTSNWYNYNDKKWANAVMVTEGTRTQHISNPAGTPVPEADILAYLVWIPRYKYQLFNSGDGTSAPEQEIQIAFENGISTTGIASCSISNLGVETCTNATNGNWYTHPAFTFGDDELTGLWIGKFETTGDATTPTIKPNITSLTTQNISTQFATSQKFNSSTYMTSGGDAHMMKNIEWGAVAYLTQSKYGRCTGGTCTEISLNNSDSYYTGRSMGAPGGSGIKTPTNEYIAQGYYTYDGKCATIHANLPAPCNTGSTGQELTDKTLAYSASTTGNIYGIYDISGGAIEHTMGVLVSTSGVLYTGQNADNNSGFTGTYGTSAAFMYTGVDFPDAKYYDKYAHGTSSVTQNRGHLGDATREIMKTYGNSTEAWHSDYADFVVSSYSWFYRGGHYGLGANAGLFSFNGGRGSASSSISWRLALQSK